MAFKQSKRFVLILVLAFLLVGFSTIFFSLLTRPNLTTDDTTEYALTIVNINNNDNDGTRETVILSEEYGCSWVIYAPVSVDLVESLKPGDQVFVRIEKDSESFVSESLFVVVVSLRTENAEYLTLDAYNEYHFQELKATRMLAAFVVLLLFLALVVSVVRFIRAKRIMKNLSNRDNYNSVLGVISKLCITNSAIWIELTEMVPQLNCNSFVISGKNCRIVKSNFNFNKLIVGEKVHILTIQPPVLTTGFVWPIASLSIDEKELLPFDKGKRNL